MTLAAQMAKSLLTTTFFLFLSLWVHAQESEKTHLRLWHQLMYSHRTVQADLIKEFEKTNPDITVESSYWETEELRTKFQASALGGIGPEIIYGPSDQVGPFFTMDLLRPLNDLIDNDTLRDLDPASVISQKAKIYLVGDTNGNFLSLIFNKNLLPQAPISTDELLHQGQNWTHGFYLVWPMQEPFFFAPWVAGFGTPFVNPEAEPQLDTPAMVSALKFIRTLRQSPFVPKEADYETANALFKEGKVAMIINGDWSWGDYKKAGINFGIAPLPKVSATGLWPATLVSTLGYSINKNIDPKKLPAIQKFLKFFLSKHAQLKFAQEVETLPSSLSARRDPLVLNNPLLKSASKIMALGQPMPIEPELRAIWDTLRTHYQAVLAEQETPAQASERAQADAKEQIQIMNNIEAPSWQAYVIKGLMALLFIWLTWKTWQWLSQVRKSFSSLGTFPYWLLTPAMIAVLVVVLFPFLFNFYISFSNLSLRTFQNYQITGWQNYIQIIESSTFYIVFAKTVVWTLTNVFVHVFLGVLLALIVNQGLPAKPLFRVLLIIPWAVPQYITALTWRGMFNSQFGLIDKVIHELLHGPTIEWFSSPLKAFSACFLTNVWLGFPFMMMITLGGLQSIPKELFEAAKVDGAGAWQSFRRITWPLLQPVLRPAIVLGCIWTFNNLNVVWLVSNGGEPADQTHILVSYVYKSAFSLYRYSSSAALSMIIFCVLMAWTIFYLRIQDPTVKGSK